MRLQRKLRGEVPRFNPLQFWMLGDMDTGLKTLFLEKSIWGARSPQATRRATQSPPVGSGARLKGATCCLSPR